MSFWINYEKNHLFTDIICNLFDQLGGRNSAVYYKTVRFQMIDKLRKRFNHSASLGKTLARTQQPHLSYAQPRQFDMHSLNQSKSMCKKPSRAEAVSTPKLASNKMAPSVPMGLWLGEGRLAIQLNRQKCGELSGEVHTASMAKSLKVNRMYKELHHFGVCVDELRWLLAEGDALLRAYLAQATLIAPHSAHTTDITHISQEFRGLLLRFQQIDRQQLVAVDECLRVTVQERLDAHQRRPLQTFPDVHSILSLKQGRESEAPSFLQTRHFSVPLKENVNTSNLPNFDNIKIIKTQATKTKITSNVKQPPLNPPMLQSVKVTPVNEVVDKNQRELQRQMELHRREKDELYKKLRQQHQKNETLVGSIEMLKTEIASLQRKLATYKVSSNKSVQKLTDILRKLASNPSPSTQQRQLQLLKMSQVLSGWQKMIEDQLQQAKYRQLYGHPEAMQGEKTQKLKEIIELQYDINQLMAYKQHLQRQEQERRGSERGSDELFRMLVMQASVLQELCSL